MTVEAKSEGFKQFRNMTLKNVMNDITRGAYINWNNYPPLNWAVFSGHFCFHTIRYYILTAFPFLIKLQFFN